MRTKNDKRNIEYVQVSTLTPYARNSRTHTPQQVKQIAASIREFGFTNPVLIDEANGIIAGHGRVMAAEHLQLDTVPCVRLDYLTDVQKRAYVIADNKLALNADWDDDMLRVELEELTSAAFELDVVGYSQQEFEALVGAWDTDLDVVGKDGSHTDGITATLKVKLSPEDEHQARELISNALEGAGLEYSIG